MPKTETISPQNEWFRADIANITIQKLKIEMKDNIRKIHPLSSHKWYKMFKLHLMLFSVGMETINNENIFYKICHLINIVRLNTF